MQAYQVRVTTMERLDQSSLHPSIKHPETDIETDYCCLFGTLTVLCTQRFVTNLTEIWVGDPRVKIRTKLNPDPGSRGLKSTRSRVWIRSTA